MPVGLHCEQLRIEPFKADPVLCYSAFSGVILFMALLCSLIIPKFSRYPSKVVRLFVCGVPVGVRLRTSADSRFTGCMERFCRAQA